ncbi:DUF4179 domain-containing protein [Bacillus salitolerans]|uniref:DUF4179 domain-containing protein n=1 Tax=Bacillus salitolerans TaxID=1437434 RepID=A0ABW4LXG2_9BACI
MTIKHEDQIERELKSFTNQPLPEKLDQQIYEGFANGRRYKNRWDVFKHTGLSVAALFLFFVLSVNYIPGFQKVAGDIPGIKKLVEMVTYDKGLQDAIENEYIQVIDKANENEGMTITIDNIIVDKRRLIIFTTLESTKDYQEVGFKSIQLQDKNGVTIGNHLLSVGTYQLENNKGSLMIDFAWNEDQDFTNELTLNVEVGEYNFESKEESERIKGAVPLSVKFPVDLEKIQLSEELIINQSVEVEGQVIHFEKLVSYPTRQVLYLSYDEKNTKDILQLVDLRLENEKGEVISREAGASINGNHRTISLTGSYFQNHKELNIVFSKVMALDKDKTSVVVDLEKSTLLEAPDQQLTLRDVTKTNMFGLENTLAINFNITPGIDGNNHFSLSGSFTDATGKIFHSGQQSSSSGEYSIYIEDQEYKSPLTFEVNYYPVYIEEEVRVRVKE